MMNIDERIAGEQKLAAYDGEDKVISSTELYKNLLDQKKRTVYLRSNIPTLDELIGGFNGGELTVGSGLTGQGKTLFFQTLTAEFAEQGKHSLWFTYEVPALQFLQQFGKDIPHFYMPALLKSNCMEWIRQRIYEAKLKYGIEAVFVDHLHFLSDVLTKRNPSLEIGQVMRTLKRWALELNIAIFLVAHTMKIKPDTELDLGDTRDSSFIEQEADNVLYIWRQKKVDRGAILKIAKNRRNGVMGKKIYLIKTERYLREVESDSRA
jgi:replicative DNA helicase